LTEVHNKPTIVCCDLWPPGALTEDKRNAYRAAAGNGEIRVRRVVYHKTSGYITVEYWSALPHAWTLDRLRQLAALHAPGQQTRMEGL